MVAVIVPDLHWKSGVSIDSSLATCSWVCFKNYVGYFVDHCGGFPSSYNSDVLCVLLLYSCLFSRSIIALVNWLLSLYFYFAGCSHKGPGPQLCSSLTRDSFLWLQPSHGFLSPAPSTPLVVGGFGHLLPQLLLPFEPSRVIPHH